MTIAIILSCLLYNSMLSIHIVRQAWHVAEFEGIFQHASLWSVAAPPSHCADFQRLVKTYTCRLSSTAATHVCNSESAKWGAIQDIASITPIRNCSFWAMDPFCIVLLAVCLAKAFKKFWRSMPDVNKLQTLPVMKMPQVVAEHDKLISSTCIAQSFLSADHMQLMELFQRFSPRNSNICRLNWKYSQKSRHTI